MINKPMDDIDKRLEEVLQLAPAEKTSEQSLAIVNDAKNALVESNKLIDSEKVKEDIDYVRDNMRNAIDKGADALKELLELSKSSQGFEHFTAFASLLKSLNETNRNLIEMHKSIVEIETTVNPEANKTEIDPNVIVGTQQAVLQMIREQLGVSRGLEAASQVLVLKADDPGLQN